jgi:hypothetical protein
VGANVNVSNAAGVQSTADIAVDPTNPDHLVAGATDLTTGYFPIGYESTDGGLSWSSNPFTPANPNNYDLFPSVAFDRLGKAYLAYLDFDVGTGSSAVLGYTKSGAGSWTSMGSIPGAAYDMPAVVVDQDTASACKDTLYIAFGDATGNILIDRSTDGGATFLQTSLTLGIRPALTRAALGPAGKLYVSWLDQDLGTLSLVSSTDCGVTFTAIAGIRTFTSGATFYVTADPNKQHFPPRRSPSTSPPAPTAGDSTRPSPTPPPPERPARTSTSCTPTTAGRPSAPPSSPTTTARPRPPTSFSPGSRWTPGTAA